MNLSDEDRAAILAEVEQYAREPRLESYEFTIRQYVEAVVTPTLTINQAADRLEKLYLQGVLKRRLVLHEGKYKHAYSKSGNELGGGPLL